MAIYYIDPTTGSADNDGLTPSAPFATFTGVLGSADDPAEIFIRRNTTLEPASGNSSPNFVAKRWPTSDDEGYAGRPQAGIDAGWDDDEDVNPVLPIPAGVSFDLPSSAGRTVSMAFHQLDMECTGNGTSNYPYFLRIYDNDITFKNLKIKGDSSSLRLIKLYGKAYSEGTTILFENVVIDNRSYDTGETNTAYSDLISLNEADHNYEREINFINCDIKGMTSIFYFHMGARENKYMQINITNSDFELGEYGLTWSGGTYSDGHRSHIKVNVVDSKIISASSYGTFVQSYTSDYGHGLELKAEDTEFLGNGYLVSSRDNSTESNYTSVLYGIELIECTVDMDGVYKNHSTYADVYIKGNLRIIGGTYRNMDFLFNFNSGGRMYLYNDAKVHISNPNLDEVTNILYSRRSRRELLGAVSLRGVIITGYIVNGYVNGGTITLEDSTVLKPLTNSECTGVSVEAIGCSIDSIKGSGCFLRAVGSRVDSPDWLVGPGASGEFIDSHLIAHSEGVAAQGANASVTSSTVSTVKDSEGKTSFVNSKVNGVVLGFRNEGVSFIKETFPGGRNAGGVSQKLSYSKTKYSGINGIINDVFYTYEAGVNQITIYAIFDSIETAETAQGFIQVISDGKLKTVALEIEDDDGEWSDYPATFVKKKLVADVLGYNILDGGRCRVTCSIAGSEDGDRKFAIDHNALGE